MIESELKILISICLLVAFVFLINKRKKTFVFFKEDDILDKNSAQKVASKITTDRSNNYHKYSLNSCLSHLK